LSNSEGLCVVDLGRRGVCVRCTSERGTTLTTVKVPKYSLSVRGERVSAFRDSGEVGLEVATL